MEFTRKPIIETIITAKEGCKLVVRSSKGAGQEEYFVDAVEVVSFGNSFFFRSQEKPKSFLVPASDYEILEVREARMVLKNVGFDRTIKIGGGREAPPKPVKEQEKVVAEISEPEESSPSTPAPTRAIERKRDRRRSFRRRRKGEDASETEEVLDAQILPPPSSAKPIELPEPKQRSKDSVREEFDFQNSVIRSLLPPPPNLISETIEKYKDNKLFEGVFIKKDEQRKANDVGVVQEEVVSLSEYDTYDVSEDDEEQIVKQRLVEEESYGDESDEDDFYDENGNSEEKLSEHEESSYQDQPLDESSSEEDDIDSLESKSSGSDENNNS